jgi:alkanesulfonate monooxygenase SsuD/methylene tetrahydromethanopterin reductase-like flavin-dependent oxidoreductase (luciferase family)
MAQKHIKLTLVEQTGVNADSGIWPHPDFPIDVRNDPKFWQQLAVKLDRGGFDALFFADTPGVRADLPHVRRGAIAKGDIPRNDPSYVVPIMAAVTEHLGFVVTSSISHEAPYSLARRYATLDHLTNGRIGWNIVANNVKTAAENHSKDDQLPHDDRYDYGDEFLSVAYRLWQGDAGYVEHHSRWLDIAAELNMEPSPQRVPVLFQAGSSDRGRRFAATHAECIYLNPNTVEQTRFLVADVRARAAAAGRDPQSPKFLPRIIPVLGSTEAEARRRFDDYYSYYDSNGAVGFFERISGIDIGNLPLAERVHIDELIGAQNPAYREVRTALGETFTILQLRQLFSFIGGGNVKVGTPEQLVDIFETYIAEADVDGFNIAYMIRDTSVVEFIDEVVPILRRRGLLAPEGEGGTSLRQRLTGHGPGLPADHPGATRRPFTQHAAAAVVNG